MYFFCSGDIKVREVSKKMKYFRLPSAVRKVLDSNSSCVRASAKAIVECCRAFPKLYCCQLSRAKLQCGISLVSTVIFVAFSF
jgi:hypothetical protein